MWTRGLNFCCREGRKSFFIECVSKIPIIIYFNITSFAYMTICCILQVRHEISAHTWVVKIVRIWHVIVDYLYVTQHSYFAQLLLHCREPINKHPNFITVPFNRIMRHNTLKCFDSRWSSP